MSSTVGVPPIVCALVCVPKTGLSGEVQRKLHLLGEIERRCRRLKDAPNEFVRRGEDLVLDRLKCIRLFDIVSVDNLLGSSIRLAHVGGRLRNCLPDLVPCGLDIVRIQNIVEYDVPSAFEYPSFVCPKSLSHIDTPALELIIVNSINAFERKPNQANPPLTVVNTSHYDNRCAVGRETSRLLVRVRECDTRDEQLLFSTGDTQQFFHEVISKPSIRPRPDFDFTRCQLYRLNE